MIKKILVLSILSLFLLTGYLFLQSKRKNDDKTLGVSSQSTPKPKTKDDNRLDVSVDDKVFSLVWLQIENPDNIILIPNFDEKLLSYEAFDKYGCKVLVSGSFYSKESKPIGLFITNNTILNSWQANRLFNGVFSINYFNVPRITNVTPKDPLRVALQAGPLLKENSHFKKLSIINDKEDRRIIIATTGENQILFFTVFDKNSAFLGPTLANLPKILEVFEKKSGIVIADALNLDGGSASVFYTDNFSLPEVTLVGSFFCLKK